MYPHTLVYTVHDCVAMTGSSIANPDPRVMLTVRLASTMRRINSVILMPALRASLEMPWRVHVFMQYAHNQHTVLLRRVGA